MAKIHGHNPTPNNTAFLAFKVCIVYRYCDGHWPVFQCVCMYVCMYECMNGYCGVQLHICIDGRLLEFYNVITSHHGRCCTFDLIVIVCVITESFKLHQTAIGIQCCLRIKLKKTFSLVFVYNWDRTQARRIFSLYK